MQGDGGVLQGGFRRGAAQSSQHLARGDPAAHGYIQADHLAAAGGGDGLSEVSLKGTAAGACNIAYPGGGRGCGGKRAWVLDPDFHLAHQRAAVAHQVGVGHRFHGAGQRLQCTGQSDLGSGAHGDAGGVGRLEGKGEGHGGGVGDVRNGRAGSDQITFFDMQLLYYAGTGGFGIETVHDGIVVELGLLDRQLGLLKGGLCTAGVDAVENVSLFHLVAYLKGGFQHLSGHHAADVVRVNGLDGAGAGDGHGHLLHLRSSGEISACQKFFSRPQHGPDDEEK